MLLEYTNKGPRYGCLFKKLIFALYTAKTDEKEKEKEEDEIFESWGPEMEARLKGLVNMKRKAMEVQKVVTASDLEEDDLKS